MLSRTPTARSHGARVAQVGLRWLVQRRITVIPKSADPRRMRENLDVFGFEPAGAEKGDIANLYANRNQFGRW